MRALLVTICLTTCACTIGSRDGLDASAPGGDAADILSLDVGQSGRDASAKADTGSSPGVDAGTAAPTGYFPKDAIWYQDVSKAAKDPESDQVIAGLGKVGWGNGGTFQIDFSIEVLQADDSTPMKSFNKTGDWYSPDCDFAPMPVPPAGALEGEDGYACTQDGDCHLLVVQTQAHKLYEMWRANISGTTFDGGCLVIWDLARSYPANGRGEGCTTADAAGFPIAPLLFSADEVKAGAIEHAIRYILPNDRIRHYVYVHPSTHSTGPTSGGSDTPPYGAHLRLRADYPLASLPNEGARVVARALQKYGMFLADGGQIALTAQSDRFTSAKWSGLLAPRDLSSLKVSDFEMVDGGARFTWSGDCVRNP